MSINRKIRSQCFLKFHCKQKMIIQLLMDCFKFLRIIFFMHLQHKIKIETYFKYLSILYFIIIFELLIKLKYLYFVKKNCFRNNTILFENIFSKLRRYKIYNLFRSSVEICRYLYMLFCNIVECCNCFCYYFIINTTLKQLTIIYNII